MKDPEFITLRNRFLFGILIVIIFTIPLLIFVFKTYSSSNVLVKINKKETFTILVTSKSCEKCDLVNDVLKENSVNYVKLNSYTNKDYDEIMRKIGIENKREEFPILIVVEEGAMKANLFSINSKSMVIDFLDFHGLINSK